MRSSFATRGSPKAKAMPLSGKTPSYAEQNQYWFVGNSQYLPNKP